MKISPNVKPVIWGMAAGAIATIVVGFSWGGWVTQGTVGQMKTASATAAVVKVLTPRCVALAEQQTDKVAVLKQESKWKHRDFVVAAGWVDDVVDNYQYEVATACADTLIGDQTTS
ncbi:MAG: hypothetical protein PVJ78_15110 [Gammaproteobacteria bacterium]|jgi:hypothetical protein